MLWPVASLSVRHARHKEAVLMTRRTFGKICAASGASAAVVPISAAALSLGASPRRHDQSTATAQDDDKLASEWLFDLFIDTQPPHAFGDHMVVPVVGGSFEGPRLKGIIVPPGGDWMTRRPDGSNVLDVRIVLRTDDRQEIAMTSRGIGYTPPGGALYARILPMFETGATKYAWLNDIVAVGVYQKKPGRIAYRVHQIL
jgi:Protein of unknown function (DUF3237)